MVEYVLMFSLLLKISLLNQVWWALHFFCGFGRPNAQKKRSKEKDTFAKRFPTQASTHPAGKRFHPHKAL